MFVLGAAWAFDAQIAVFGRGQAPVVTGVVQPGASGATLDAHVIATGIRSSDRIVVFAFESSDEHGDRNSKKIPLYYSKSGPDMDGRVDLPVRAEVPNTDATAYPYMFVTAVLGEDQRDCDGELIEGTGPAQPNETACLTWQKPGAGNLAAATLPATPSATSTPAPNTTGTQSASARTVPVAAAAAWTDTGEDLNWGQQFAVRATGQVSYVNGGPLIGPAGASDLHPNVCVLPGATHHAALIGRITGDPSGAPFYIGDNYTGVADQTGRLSLGINDTGVDNNSGSFKWNKPAHRVSSTAKGQARGAA